MTSITASYTPSEGDEGGTLQVLVSFGSENATSNTNAAVQDAAPTVTVPTISSNDSVGSSTVREGDMLTASASSGQADNVVTYAWYSSADGFTNPIGTGATYTVQEGNEGATLEVKATATNDNGATASATSAATAAVIDNSSISLAMSVVGNAVVQEGQTLVASATITGDADDANATVTYQWQSSNDGGATWTNVAATTSGFFSQAGAPATLSSFYQLSEADEGKLLRVTASFADDTGQVVSATSSPTATVSVITST